MTSGLGAGTTGSHRAGQIDPELDQPGLAHWGGLCQSHQVRTLRGTLGICPASEARIWVVEAEPNCSLGLEGLTSLELHERERIHPLADPPPPDIPQLPPDPTPDGLPSLPGLSTVSYKIFCPGLSQLPYTPSPYPSWTPDDLSRRSCTPWISECGNASPSL